MYNSSCKEELKSNVVGKYYNSIEYTNHNVQHVSSEGKNDENLEKSLSKVPPIEIKLYKRRFLMLFLASFCSMMNAVPQFQFSVIADIVACYYGVSVNAADWTSIVYMVIFLPLVFPVMFLMDKKGLRYTVLGGGFLNCLGKILENYYYINLFNRLDSKFFEIIEIFIITNTLKRFRSQLKISQIKNLDLKKKFVK